MTTDQAAYMRDYRTDPDRRRRHNEQQRAHSYALAELARMYPDDYHRLYARNLGKIRGIPVA